MVYGNYSGRPVVCPSEETNLNQESDSAEIHRVLQGDTDAFRVLIREYEGPLFGFVGRILRSREDREDVVQEAFLKAYAGLSSYDGRKGNFSAWLFRIARNLALNALKKRRPLPVAEVPEPKAGTTRDPEVFVELDRALGTLPPDQRTAFELAELYGFSYEEVAVIEGVKTGTVRSRISRAREKLREALTPFRETDR